MFYTQASWGLHGFTLTIQSTSSTHLYRTSTASSSHPRPVLILENHHLSSPRLMNLELRLIVTLVPPSPGNMSVSPSKRGLAHPQYRCSGPLFAVHEAAALRSLSAASDASAHLPRCQTRALRGEGSCIVMSVDGDDSMCACILL